MKISYLKRNDIDTHKWDSCVQNSQAPMIYGISWYLDIMAENWAGMVLGDYKAVLPLIYKSKYGFKYMYRSPLIQQNGLFFSKETNEDLLKEFIENIPKKFKVIEFSFTSGFNYENLNLHRNINYTLYLNKSYEELSKAIKGNTRRSVNKATRNGMQVEVSSDYSKLIAFKKANSVNLLSDEIYSRIELLIKQGLNKELVEIYFVRNSEGLLVASCFFLFYEKTAYYLLSASIKSPQNQGVPALMLNEFIKNHAGTDITLDFEGSNIAGVAKFFSSFGSSPNNYFSYKAENLGILKLLKK